jgi:hypothetical protein
MSTLCFQDLSIQRRGWSARSSRLFLAKSRRTLVLNLLVESVTVTDGGDVVALQNKYGVSECFGNGGAVASPVYRSHTVPPAVASDETKTCDSTLVRLPRVRARILQSFPELR